MKHDPTSAPTSASSTSESSTSAPPPIQLKRFLAFAGDFDSPCGGWRDFQGSYDSMDEAWESAAWSAIPYDGTAIQD